jgi:hypothetical protein
MWVFDGKGLTMACLAVWIRKRPRVKGFSLDHDAIKWNRS